MTGDNVNMWDGEDWDVTEKRMMNLSLEQIQQGKGDADQQVELIERES